MNKIKLSIVALGFLATVSNASNFDINGVLNIGQVKTDFANGVITDTNNNYSIGVEVLKEFGFVKLGVGALYDVVKSGDGDSKSIEIDLIVSKKIDKITANLILGKSSTDLSTNQTGETLLMGFGVDYSINKNISAGILYKQGDMDISATSYDMEVKYTQISAKYKF